MGQIAVYGGSFDPVHRGHEAVARAVLDSGRVDRVIWVPAGASPFKHVEGQGHASAADRLAMLECVVAGESRVSVSRVELDRAGPSYSVETLEALSAEHPGDALVWVVGADSVEGLGRWHRAGELLGRFGVLVVPRPGWERGRCETLLDEHGRHLGVQVRWAWVEMDEVRVSSREIRGRLRRGESIADLVSEGVGAYICEHGLYR